MHAGLLQRNHLAMLPSTIPLPKLTHLSLFNQTISWVSEPESKSGWRMGGAEPGLQGTGLPQGSWNSFAEILPPTGFLVKGRMTISPKDFEAMTHATKREVVKQKELSTKENTSSAKYHIDLWRLTFILFIKETFGDPTWSWVEPPLFCGPVLVLICQ